MWGDHIHIKYSQNTSRNNHVNGILHIQKRLFILKIYISWNFFVFKNLFTWIVHFVRRYKLTFSFVILVPMRTDYYITGRDKAKPQSKMRRLNIV